MGRQRRRKAWEWRRKRRGIGKLVRAAHERALEYIERSIWRNAGLVMTKMIKSLEPTLCRPYAEVFVGARVIFTHSVLAFLQQGCRQSGRASQALQAGAAGRQARLDRVLARLQQLRGCRLDELAGCAEQLQAWGREVGGSDVVSLLTRLQQQNP
jgi:hypothetical protein